MTIETAKILSVVFFTIAGISLATAVAFFFLFKIPKIIAVVTGKTAKKAIENIQEENARTGSVTRSNLRGRTGATGKISKATRFQRPETGKLSQPPAQAVAVASPPPADAQNTTRLAQQAAAPVVATMQQSAGVANQQAVVPASADTTLLDTTAVPTDTTLLDATAVPTDTTLLAPAPDYGETSVLDAPNYGETSVLGVAGNYGETSVLGAPMHNAASAFLFHVDVEISFAESKEIVE